MLLVRLLVGGWLRQMAGATILCFARSEMKVNWFHLMPYRFLPANFENDHHSVWVDIPTGLFDPLRGHNLYNEFLDEIEFADKMGFDGVCVNEHHANAYGMMPSPNLMAAAIARRTTSANLIV